MLMQLCLSRSRGVLGMECFSKYAGEAAELAGEYVGLFFDQTAPHDGERQIAERIQVRRAAFWERII